jgi:hypothetical protein
VLAERGFQPTFAAGHSLGEYSAHVTPALTFVACGPHRGSRGQYMQRAVPPGEGAMRCHPRLSAPPSAIPPRPDQLLLPTAPEAQNFSSKTAVVSRPTSTPLTNRSSQEPQRPSSSPPTAAKGPAAHRHASGKRPSAPAARLMPRQRPRIPRLQ